MGLPGGLFNGCLELLLQVDQLGLQTREALAFAERWHRVREEHGQNEHKAANGNPVWECRILRGTLAHDVRRHRNPWLG
jgi:hypothetical protein